MCDYLGTDNVGYEQGSDILKVMRICFQKQLLLPKTAILLCFVWVILRILREKRGDANNPYCAGDRIKIELPDCQMKLLDAVKKLMTT